MHAKLTYNVSYSLKSLSIYKYDKWSTFTLFMKWGEGK
jgi:hypothetical protein